mmetsp:Transcript_18184/g.28268  ORF Transcript_18184/g.28268 Transcript_18184/m.28268 type:complete len:329 (+) Transcript_18184:208-1194(+)|eukprot:CAMPEP_0196801652 /NCGR_PEP_ID=MMETSP1362-20130617/1418_1 /TAXON_ID=163516 /ORGANISM="Leptocylindrus danicus, Strain CCMP1856" /LENGTH=328 /DNA_ID=CAMNT_0042172715 /DNA_START=173 /DNA_END=1159 /DNA_ORIENTATION=+
MAPQLELYDKSKSSYLLKFIGFLQTSFFTLSYLGIPLYLISGTFVFLQHGPMARFPWLYNLPIIISMLVPCIHMPWFTATILRPILDFFEYDFIGETSDEEILNSIFSGKKKKVMFVCQPHGVLSFGGFCSKIAMPPKFYPMPTAVASSLLSTPILKHVIGIWNLTDASSKNLRKVFKRDGTAGCAVLYVGGIAELFRCSLTEERLYLSKRKGFIKIALREGVEIIPAYFFGNTSVLSVATTGPIAALARKTGVTLTYFWGLWGLPLPRWGEKVMYVRGTPLGLPHIPEPTDEDIDKWHKVYCDEVRRIYEKYREKIPHYANKPLIID